MDELWKPVERFPGYEISSLGRLRSFKRYKDGRIINPSKRGRYWGIGLYQNGITTSVRIHTLVALAFLGPRPDGYYICHRDGNTDNNTVDNLYYGTPTDNMADAKRQGRTNFGVRATCAKLNDRKVRVIRGLYKCGFTVPRIANIFGMTLRPIYAVINRETWAHVE